MWHLLLTTSKLLVKFQTFEYQGFKLKHLNSIEDPQYLSLDGLTGFTDPKIDNSIKNSYVSNRDGW